MQDRILIHDERTLPNKFKTHDFAVCLDNMFVCRRLSLGYGSKLTIQYRSSWRFSGPNVYCPPFGGISCRSCSSWLLVVVPFFLVKSLCFISDYWLKYP